MKSLLPAFAAASLIALAACNSKPATPEVVDTNPDPMKNELAKRSPIELPPSIKADKTLRCKDNSLVYVTFFDGDKLANIRLDPAGPSTRVTAPAAGEPLTADGGWKMTGTPTSITLTTPTKPAQVCKA